MQFRNNDGSFFLYVRNRSCFIWFLSLTQLVFPLIVRKTFLVHRMSKNTKTTRFTLVFLAILPKYSSLSPSTHMLQDRLRNSITTMDFFYRKSLSSDYKSRPAFFAFSFPMVVHDWLFRLSPRSLLVLVWSISEGAVSMLLFHIMHGSKFVLDSCGFPLLFARRGIITTLEPVD